MDKKLLMLLSRLSENIKDSEFDREEIFNMLHIDELDLSGLEEELEALEFSEGLEEEMLDNLKSLLVYILLKSSDYDAEDVYSVVFGGGRRIMWN